MRSHRIKRVLVEFEQDDQSYELEMKDILPQDGKLDLSLVHRDPENLPGPGEPTPSAAHFAILELRVLKRSAAQGGTLPMWTMREVRGS